MRLLERFGVVVLGLLLIGCGERGVQQPPMIALGQVNANNVNIIVRCQGQQADIGLKPWRRAIGGQESVTFNLRGGANVVSQVLIVPKPGTSLSSWPCNGDTITVARGQSTTTDPAPANNSRNDVVYPYSLLAECDFAAQGQNARGGSRGILVDPDLIVRGAGAGDSV